MAISALKKQEEDRWRPVTEALPKEDGDYLVTFESGYAEDYGFDLIGIAPFEVDCEGFGIWRDSKALAHWEASGLIFKSQHGVRSPNPTRRKNHEIYR